MEMDMLILISPITTIQLLLFMSMLLAIVLAETVEKQLKLPQLVEVVNLAVNSELYVSRLNSYGLHDSSKIITVV